MPQVRRQPKRAAEGEVRPSDRRSDVAGLVAWPGVRIKLPSYVRAQRYELDPTGRLLAPAGPVVDEPWRGQTYLVLFALDLADPEAILAFVNRFGMLSVFRDWELLGGGLANYLLDDVEERVFTARTSVKDTPEAQEWLAARIDPRVARVDPEYAKEQLWEFCESLDEFRFGARLIRDLTRAWRYLDDPDSSAQPEWELPLELDEWVDPGLELAGNLLSVGLTNILTAMHPRIRFDLSRAGTATPGLVTTRTPFGSDDSFGLDRPGSNPGLGLVCALELHNQLLLGAAYKQCRSDSCDRLFIFQEDERDSGRPAAHQYKPRRDSLYCSPQCLRAQIQRQHRRRKEAEYGSFAAPLPRSAQR